MCCRAYLCPIESVSRMTQGQTPNTQNQDKPNNLAAIDKRVADAKAAEQQPAVQAPAEAQTDGRPAQPGMHAPAPAQQGDISVADSSATKN